MESSNDEGNISSFSQRELICIEYPGFIKSIDNMLTTLGGIETISRTCLQTKERLELKYRPRDPNCKSAFGQLHNSRGLLVRVKRKRKKRMEDGNPGPWFYEQNVLGVVSGVYKYDGMMDFQYLTPPTLVDSYKQLFGRELLNSIEPFFPVPKIFTRIDTPGVYHFRGTLADPSAKPSRINKVGPQEKDDVDTVTRKERKGFGLAALYTSNKIPSEPLPESKAKVEKLLQQFPINKEDVEHFIKLFEKRPLWQRGGIESESSLTKELFRSVLPCYAYYWMNGPWGRLWCRLGYDPREHPEAYIYQQIECRIKSNPLNLHKVGTSRKDVRLPAPLRHGKKKIGNLFEAADQPVEDDAVVKQPYGFYPGELPKARQVRYQLCDIYDDEIIGMIKDVTLGECSEQNGFLPEGMLTKIREIVKSRIKEAIRLNETEATAETEDTKDEIDENAQDDVSADDEDD